MAPIRDSVVHNLIQLAYIAASDPTKWSSFLERLRGTIDAGNAILGFVDKSSGGATINAAVGYQPDALRRWAEFSHLDPFANGLAALGPLKPGFIGLAQDLISDEELERTEFYQRFGRHYGAIGGVICVVYAEEPLVAFVGCNRRPGRHFGAAEVNLLQTLLPHLRTAFQIHRQLNQDRLIGHAALATLNRLQSAVFICDDEANVLHTNAAATSLRKSHVRDGRLSLPVRSEMTRLHRAIRGAAERSGDTGETIVRVDAGAGGPHLALVTAVHHGTVVPMTRPLVAVVFHASKPLSAESMDTLARLYHFTAAEARLAEALLRGDSVREAAARSALSYESARTYVKRLLHKTGVRRQAELVRVLLTSLPPIERQPADV